MPKKIKKRNFFCKSFLVFLMAIFFPLFFRLSRQQKSRILFRFCCIKNFFFFNKVIKPVFGKQILNCLYKIFFCYTVNIKTITLKDISIIIWSVFPSTFGQFPCFTDIGCFTRKITITNYFFSIVKNP